MHVSPKWLILQRPPIASVRIPRLERLKFKKAKPDRHAVQCKQGGKIRYMMDSRVTEHKHQVETDDEVGREGRIDRGVADGLNHFISLMVIWGR